MDNPQKIPVVIRDRLYIPRVEKYPTLHSDIKCEFTHKNPAYSKNKAMGFYVNEHDKFQPNYEENVSVTEFDNVPTLAVPRGGTNQLREIFQRYGCVPWWIDHRLCLKPVEERPGKPYSNSVTLWPEQERLVAAMLKHENCLVRSPTASGKTEAALKLVEYLLQIAGPVLILVWEGSPRSGLMKQWIDRIFQRFEINRSEIGVLGGGNKKVRNITVGMQQTLRNCAGEYVGCFGSIICDEVQRFAARTFQEVIGKFPARFRIGISADERRKDGNEPLIYDAFGSVVEEIDKKSLLERNLICPVIVRVIPTDFNYFMQVGNESIAWIDLPSALKNAHEFYRVMFNNQERENLIASFVLPCLKAGNSTLITSLRRDHVAKWQSFLIAQGYHCGIMVGGQQDEGTFEIAESGLRNKSMQVAVGTIQKMSTAHDIPPLERCFVLGPLAGNKQLFNQMMGRIGRSYPGKEIAYLYYFWDIRCYPNHLNMLKRAKYDIEIFDHSKGIFA